MSEWIHPPDWMMPHGHCVRWSWGVLGPEVAGNFGIALTYACICLALWWIAARWRNDIERVAGIDGVQVVWLTTVIFAMCGLTHVMQVVTVWVPLFRLSGLLSLATFALALYSLPTYFRAARRVRWTRDQLRLRPGNALEQIGQDLDKIARMAEEL